MRCAVWVLRQRHRVGHFLDHTVLLLRNSVHRDDTAIVVREHHDPAITLPRVDCGLTARVENLGVDQHDGLKLLSRVLTSPDNDRSSACTGRSRRAVRSRG